VLIGVLTNEDLEDIAGAIVYGSRIGPHAAYGPPSRILAMSVADN